MTEARMSASCTPRRLPLHREQPERQLRQGMRRKRQRQRQRPQRRQVHAADCGGSSTTRPCYATATAALLSLLAWLSATATNQTCLASQPVLQQKRIPPPKRHVSYHARHDYDKFWIPPSASDSVAKDSQRELQKLPLVTYRTVHQNRRRISPERKSLDSPEKEVDGHDDGGGGAQAESGTVTWTSVLANAAKHSPDSIDRSATAHSADTAADRRSSPSSTRLRTGTQDAAGGARIESHASRDDDDNAADGLGDGDDGTRSFFRRLYVQLAGRGQGEDGGNQAGVDSSGGGGQSTTPVVELAGDRGERDSVADADAPVRALAQSSPQESGSDGTDGMNDTNDAPDSSPSFSTTAYAVDSNLVHADNTTWNVSTSFEHTIINGTEHFDGTNSTNSSSSSSTSPGSESNSVVYVNVDPAPGEVAAESTTTNNEGVSDNGFDDSNPSSSLPPPRPPRFQPIRIYATLAESSESGNVLADWQRDVLFNDLLSPALLAWSAALRVIPVQGNLTVDAYQLLDGKSCGPGIDSGLPSIRVPEEHLTIGVPQTDLIIYLSLGFVEPAGQSETKPPVHDSASDFVTDGPRDPQPTNGTVDQTHDGENEGIASQGTGDNNETNSTEPEMTAAVHCGTADINVTHANSSTGTDPLPASNHSMCSQRNETESQDNSTTTVDEDSSLSPSSPPSSPPTESNQYDGTCTGDYLAATSFCSTDQYDRPTAALLHICIDRGFYYPSNRNRNIQTLMHELGHALGFNAVSMAHFRRQDGTPITPRTASGAVPDRLVECTGPSRQSQPSNDVSATQRSTPNKAETKPTNAPTTDATVDLPDNSTVSNTAGTLQTDDVEEQVASNETQSDSDQQQSDGELHIHDSPETENGDGHSDNRGEKPSGSQATGRVWATVALPSEEILRFRTVRGGVRVAEIVTPSVSQVVRNQFDCQQLAGAELESGESMPLVASTNEFENGCLGDHWERRLFSTDLMNPVVDSQQFSTRISTLTLAYFADSGWYQVDLSRASSASGWGRGAGCGFVDDTCIGTDGQVPAHSAPFFCNAAPSSHPDDTTAANIHGCTSDLNRKAVCSIGQYDPDMIPPEYRYFQRTYGADVGGSDSLMDFCPVYTGYANGLCSSSENELLLQASPMERFGQRNSRCVLGSSSSFNEAALCMPIACVVEDLSLRIEVDGVWHVCNHQGDYIETKDVVVKCPDPRRTCPTFYCPYDCLGTGGFCDYESGKCICKDHNGGIAPTFFPCDEQDEDDDFPGAETVFINSNSATENRELSSRMPASDDPLNDIYVETTAALSNGTKDRTVLKVSVAVIVCCIAVAVLCTCIAASGIMIRESIHRRRRAWLHHEIDATMPGPPATTVMHSTAGHVNRNKDKMVATVLVDLRIRNHDDEIPMVSLAETDLQMTDSEQDRSEMLSEVSSASPSNASSSIAQSVRSMGSVRETVLPAEETQPAEHSIIRRRRQC